MVVSSKDSEINQERGDNNMTTNSSSTELSSLRQLGVLGIGLIMEEVGKGARLVFRYPASPPPFFSISRGGQPDMKNNKSNTHTSSTKNKKDIGDGGSTTDGSGSNDSIDLFFDLPARVISKLFRPKRPLCGQPLTLNVSGTTFCCRAELFDSHPSTIGGESSSNHPLVLFSVIVALAPVSPSIRASMAENQSSNNSPMQYKNPSNVDDIHIRNSPNIHAVDSTQSRSDAAFLTITKIHRNLARLCLVLKREEIRCNYVSRQCDMLLQIKKEYELRVGPECSGSNDSSVPNNNKTSTTGDIGSKKGDIIPPTSPKGNNNITNNSKEQKKTKVISDDDDHDKTNQMTQEQRREYVQDLIENLLAASPPTDIADDDNDVDGDIKLQGNLARELANVFHFISSSTTTNTSNNLRREGVVYVNRHVAVPLEPIDQLSKTQNQYSIEPHQTLLFPTQSASEVLNGLIDDGMNDMSASSSSISQTLCRLLPNIQPRKSLTDIAWDSSVSLTHAMNAAAWLISSGICIAATPILRKNRYKCVDGIVQKMAKLALPFWQTFGIRSQQYQFYWGGSVAAGAPHIFVVVSSLTSKRKDGLSISASPTLGEAFDLLIGRQAADSSPHLKRHNSRASSSSLGSLRQGEDETAEQILYSMAVWLIANRVIVLA